jgi:cytoskeletal protein RodZ
MPETRVERLLFLLGLGVTGVLVAVVILGRHPSERASPATPTTTPPTTVSVTSTSFSTPTTTARTPTTAPTTTSQTTTPAVTTTGTASQTRLAVTARADTWVSIRRDTPTGAVLFEGTLAAGDSRSFSGAKFAVRFGAAANVQAKLDGRPLSLPGGTYSTTITRAGLGPRSA